MRILQVTEASSAGVGRHVADLCAELRDRGHEVHAIYSPIREDAEFVTDVVKNDGITTRSIPMRRAPHPSDVIAARRLHSYVSDHGPFDVIHAHSSKAGGIVRWRRGGKRSRIFYTPHCISTMNPSLGGAARYVLGAIERALARRTDAVIAVSADEKDHLLTLGIQPQRVRLVPNGIRRIQFVDRGEARRRFGIPEDSFVIGFVGRFSEQKNPELLIHAFARLAEHTANGRRLFLAMVGEGELRTRCEVLSRGLDISNRVAWLGHKTAIETMRAFDVFALPSRYEGMPYVLLESQAAGLPIIANRVGGIDSVIENGQHGLIIDDADAQSFARGLEQLCDPQITATMAQAAAANAQRFSVTRMVDRILTLYGQRTDDLVPIAESPELIANS